MANQVIDRLNVGHSGICFCYFEPCCPIYTKCQMTTPQMLCGENRNECILTKSETAENTMRRFFCDFYLKGQHDSAVSLTNDNHRCRSTLYCISDQFLTDNGGGERERERERLTDWTLTACQCLSFKHPFSDTAYMWTVTVYQCLCSRHPFFLYRLYVDCNSLSVQLLQTSISWYFLHMNCSSLRWPCAVYRMLKSNY